MAAGILRREVKWGLRMVDGAGGVAGGGGGFWRQLPWLRVYGGSRENRKTLVYIGCGTRRRTQERGERNSTESDEHVI